MQHESLRATQNLAASRRSGDVVLQSRSRRTEREYELTNTMEPKKEIHNKGGRKPKLNPVKHRYMVNFNDDENALFRQRFEQSGLDCYSKYIKAVLFKRELKVVKIDKTTLDYYVRLTQFYRQFQAIGNNYNQIVRALKSNFGEKRALQMLYRLEQRTVELVVLSKHIITLTQDYERRWLQR